MREWNGRSYQVEVVEGGFRKDGIQDTEDDAVRKLMQADFDHAKKMVAIIDTLIEQIGYCGSVTG